MFYNVIQHLEDYRYNMFISRSIIEPVRNTKFREESHYQLAKAVSLDPTKRIIYCKHLLEEGSDTYPLSYDKLVIGVGAQPNTFNVPGVTEHAFFLKVTWLQWLQ